jgi:succinoglycan biosynthesis transport protein ExoP
MNEVETYRGQVVDYSTDNFEDQPPHDSHSTSDLIRGILRRWYIVMVVFIVICAAGLPVIWFVIEPLYSVTGAIRVAPILPNILTGEGDRTELSTYQSFLHTTSKMILSPQVVQRVADNLADKNLAFFDSEPASLVSKLKHTFNNDKVKPEPAAILKQAISSGIITAAPERNTELIEVTVQSKNIGEAGRIVDAFINAYMEVEASSSTQDEEQNLSLLETEYGLLAAKKKSLREDIKKKSQKFGSASLDSRQEMRLRRIGILLTEFTTWEANRIRLEAQIEMLKNRLETTNASVEGQADEQQILTAEANVAVDHNDPNRLNYINADPTLNAYIENLVALEQDYVVAKIRLAHTNPELEKKASIINDLKEQIKQRRKELGDTYDSYVAKRNAEMKKQDLLKAEIELAKLQSELELTKMYEQRYDGMLSKENEETIELGRTQLEIQELQDELSSTNQTYEKIGRRIDELKMERKQPARVSVAHYADFSSVSDKRIKFSAAMVFCAFACGAFLAFLRDKADLRLRTPDDVVKRIGIRIIGTTTSSYDVKRAMLPEQIAGDYQTIRANLQLLNGDRLPKKLVIASPGMREGKTTFAINLATSMSKSGKKVLLIDGDLRKPDIARMLNLPKGLRGLQDVLFGKNFEQAVYSMHSTGLDVLAADSRNREDAYELLSVPLASQHINSISQRYDHVIIDTPPVLAFPDAMLWAKMADAVILTSFAGQTTAPDLRDATDKLAQIHVKVLGAVLSNVGIGQSYYRYGYNYYAQSTRSKKSSKRAAEKLLLPMQNQEDGTKDLDF